MLRGGVARLQLLDEGGYRGPLTLEVELDGAPATPEIVDAALARSLAYLEGAFHGNWVRRNRPPA